MKFKTLEELEKDQVNNVLNYTKGDVESAACILGVSKKTVYNKIKKYAKERQECIGLQNTSQQVIKI